MLRNYVAETSVAPGTVASINLAGAVSGRQTFAAAFASGALAYYFITDGTQAEWGWGTFTAGTPNVFTRTTVLSTTAGSTSRLNFTGTATIYCEIPAERAIYADSTNKVSTPSDLAVGGALTVSTSFTLTAGNLTVANGNIVVTVGSISAAGGLAIQGGAAIAGGLSVTSGSIVQDAGNAPATSSSTGVPGQIGWDSGFLYICVATNTWKRVALSTF